MAYNYTGYQPMFTGYQPMYSPQYGAPGAGQQVVTPQIQPQTSPQAPNTQQTQSGMIWVQGEAGAKSYMVAPGNTVVLWDSENQTIYIKTADASGMPSMRILDYSIRDNAPKAPQIAANSDFVTRDELASVRQEINALRAKYEATEGKKGKAAKDE